MKKGFLHSLDYNDWANEKLIVFINSNKNIPERCYSLICHIIATQDYWYDRLVNKSIYLIDLWENYQKNELLPLSQNSSDTWKSFINKSREKDFQELCGYYNEKWEANDISFGDILNHVLNHSAYHRGQINLLLKTAGFDPVDVDFKSYSSF